MFMTIPTEVARSICYKNMHPVTAWRIYYNLDQETFSKFLGYPLELIQKIETSNLHLREDICKQISSAFGIHPLSIQSRFINV